jgi:thiamine-phosphate pyrophosphorylase
VHLPERGLPIAAARAEISRRAGFAIGASRHGTDGALAAAAAGAELVQLGPIWPTPSKAGVIDALSPAALAVRADLPAHVRLVAVGGIVDAAHAHLARTAGADAVAAIRAIWSAPSPAAAVAALLA